MVEGLYVLSMLEGSNDMKQALLEKFTKVAVDHADHLQPGYVSCQWPKQCSTHAVITSIGVFTGRFAAFFLSAFPNTTDYKIPQGVLQGACMSSYHHYIAACIHNWAHPIVIVHIIYS